MNSVDLLFVRKGYFRTYTTPLFTSFLEF